MPFSTKNLHDLRLKSGQNRDNFFKIFGGTLLPEICIRDMGGELPNNAAVCLPNISLITSAV